MMMKASTVRLGGGVLLLACLLLLIPGTGQSCPVCYGETDGRTAEGINLAVLSMIGVTGGVLGGILAFIFSLKRRAARAVTSPTAQRTIH